MVLNYRICEKESFKAENVPFGRTFAKMYQNGGNQMKGMWPFYSGKTSKGILILFLFGILLFNIGMIPKMMGTYGESHSKHETDPNIPSDSEIHRMLVFSGFANNFHVSDMNVMILRAQLNLDDEQITEIMKLQILEEERLIQGRTCSDLEIANANEKSNLGDSQDISDCKKEYEKKHQVVIASVTNLRRILGVKLADFICWIEDESFIAESRFIAKRKKKLDRAQEAKNIRDKYINVFNSRMVGRPEWAKSAAKGKKEEFLRVHLQIIKLRALCSLEQIGRYQKEEWLQIQAKYTSKLAALYMEEKKNGG